MRMRFVSLTVLLALAGCGTGSAPLPRADVARTALETGLNAWKEGKPFASLAEGKPAIDFVDFEWKAGKKLAAFTIDSDRVDQGTHTFGVSLTLQSESKSQGESKAKNVEYMVLGTDPLHIFRDEDYTRTLNMENNPAAPAKKAAPRR